MLTRERIEHICKEFLKNHDCALDESDACDADMKHVLAHDAEQRQTITTAIQAIEGMGFSAEVASGYNLTQLLASVATKLTAQAARIANLEHASQQRQEALDALIQNHPDVKKVLSKILVRQCQSNLSRKVEQLEAELELVARGVCRD